MYQHGTGGSSEPPKRNGPTPSIDSTSGNHTLAPWQPKIPDPPNRAGGPIRHQQRYIPTAPQQQYKSRVTQQFLNPETPAYFPSYTSSTPNAVAQPSIHQISITPRNPISAFPTPVHRYSHFKFPILNIILNRQYFWTQTTSFCNGSSCKPTRIDLKTAAFTSTTKAGQWLQ